MKLKNKKTGKIVTAETYRCGGNCSIELVFAEEDQPPCEYNSLAELCKEWEDYEEPKVSWVITCDGKIITTAEDFTEISECEEIGNKFETEEEAEKAVEKLKALARLEKAGLKIEAEYVGDDDIGSIMAGHLYYDLHCFFKFYYGFGDDLNTLFGGKE